MKRCLALFFGTALWLLSFGAQALVLQANQGKDQPVGLGQEAEVFRDVSGNVTIDDILAGRPEIGFVPMKSWHREDHSSDVFWVRFSLRRESGAPPDWVVQVFPSWIDDIRIYARNSDGTISVSELGDRHSFASRAMRTSALAFPVFVNSAAETYYLRIKTHGLVPLCLHAWQKSGLQEEETKRLVFFSAFAGAIVVMVLMNLIFWAWLRNSIYPVYALFLAAMLVAIVSMQGYASPLLLPEEPLYADRFVDVASCVLMSVAAVFACRFFNYRQYSVWAARFMNSAAAVFAAMAVLAMWGVDGAIRVAACLEIVVGLFNVAFLVWLMARHRAFQYLLAALVFYAVNLSWLFFLLVLLGFVHIAQPFILESWIPLLQLANLLLLNFAVASRSRQAELKWRADRKLAFNSMRVAKQALEDRVRQREFVAVVSHEFRTPLAIVDAVAHALELSPSGQDDRVKLGMEKIRRATRRLTALIENILLDDSLEVGAMHSARSFDLRDVVGNLRGIGLPEENARLSIEVAPDRAMCRGDQERVEMAIRNLVQNALKYSPADSMVAVRCEADGDFFSVTVSNKGMPIPESERRSLFERYFRGAASAQVPGSGLGLHISRTTARQHGGDVELVSSDRDGTVFRLTLPLESGLQNRHVPDPAGFGAIAMKA
jgi:signal transduction histidine kinase